MSFIILCIVFWSAIIAGWLGIAFTFAGVGWLIYKGWLGLKKRVRWKPFPPGRYSLGFALSFDRSEGPSIRVAPLKGIALLQWKRR